MALAEEAIGAGGERPDMDGDLLAARYHLLDVEVLALEFLRRGSALITVSEKASPAGTCSVSGTKR